MAARRERGDEQIHWTSKDGAAHSTMCGEICIDGAGGTRSYGKGYKGTTAAANAFDMLTKLPLDVKCMQASY